jgi:hypothetical protein
LSRGVLPSVVCLSVIWKPPRKGGVLGPIWAVVPQERKGKERKVGNFSVLEFSLDLGCGTVSLGDCVRLFETLWWSQFQVSEFLMNISARAVETTTLF